MKKPNSNLYVVMDGDFNLHRGVPVSNRNHFEIFGKRYSPFFDNVTIMCRVHSVEDPSGLAIAGANVSVHMLPPIHGLAGLMRHSLSLMRAFWQVPRSDTSVILRVPGIFPTIAAVVFALRGVPFSVEAMADADAQFAPGAYRGKFRAFYRLVWVSAMRWQCKRAHASAYVTRSSLQLTFPPKKEAFSTNYTTLDLPHQAIREEARSSESFRSKRLRLVNVAMMQKHLKGQDIILRALAKVRDTVDVELWLIGDGETRPEFEELARSLGVADIVHFYGRANAGSEVMQLLDASDVFVLPSRQEGLPRVLIEAMARGLPCIASDLPGCAELLQETTLVKGNDLNEWIKVLTRFLSEPEDLAYQSARNLETVQEYSIDFVQARREAFYSEVAKV